MASGDTGDNGDKPPVTVVTTPKPRKQGFLPHWVMKTGEKPGNFPGIQGKTGKPGTHWVKNGGSAGAGDKWPFRAQEALF